MGVARSFQSPIIPAGLTVSEVVASALFRRRPGGMAAAGMAAAVLRLPGFRRARAADAAAAWSALSQVGLAPMGGLPADTQPLGTRRLIEIARVIASRPGVVLCDEPASGLSADEVAGLSELLRRLAEAGATVLVVEHNVQFVMGVADEVVVLQEGAVIARGDPPSVRADPAVIASYLGGPLPTVGAGEGDR
jgi:branched-chain amino acid transport system permease protein